MAEASIVSATAELALGEPQARHVVYCGVCTLPPEYCEFGGTVKKCEDWVRENHPDLHARIYSEDAQNAPSLTPLTPAALARAQKDATKKAAKALATEQREAAAKASSKVLIKRVERSKRKYVTAIQGLEAFGLDLKKVAKELGKKFATGASVTKVPGSGEEIVVQGDLSDEVEEWLGEHYEQIPEDNIELIEDKKKKGGGGAT